MVHLPVNYDVPYNVTSDLVFQNFRGAFRRVKETLVSDVIPEFYQYEIEQTSEPDNGLGLNEVYASEVAAFLDSELYRWTQWQHDLTGDSVTESFENSLSIEVPDGEYIAAAKVEILSAPRNSKRRMPNELLGLYGWVTFEHLHGLEARQFINQDIQSVFPVIPGSTKLILNVAPNTLGFVTVYFGAHADASGSQFAGVQYPLTLERFAEPVFPMPE